MTSRTRSLARVWAADAVTCIQRLSQRNVDVRHERRLGPAYLVPIILLCSVVQCPSKQSVGLPRRAGVPSNTSWTAAFHLRRHCPPSKTLTLDTARTLPVRYLKSRARHILPRGSPSATVLPVCAAPSRRLFAPSETRARVQASSSSSSCNAPARHTYAFCTLVTTRLRASTAQTALMPFQTRHVPVVQ